MTSHRTPWYQVENKDIAPIWLSVFSRGSMKVIRNTARIKNLTTFHGVYCNDDYSDFIDILFCYLLTPVAQELLRENKREYGDGLDKMEPNDINDASVLDFKIMSEMDRNRVSDIYLSIVANNDCEPYISELDSLFGKYINTNTLNTPMTQ